MKACAFVAQSAASYRAFPHFTRAQGPKVCARNGADVTTQLYDDAAGGEGPDGNVEVHARPHPSTYLELLLLGSH